jgi:hypothetical protein
MTFENEATMCLEPRSPSTDSVPARIEEQCRNRRGRQRRLSRFQGFPVGFGHVSYKRHRICESEGTYGIRDV